jgi:hypothetical protein
VLLWGGGAAGYASRTDEEQALATVRAVLDSPITFLDTAAPYGDGEGEDLVGPSSQKQVELTGDSLANDLALGVVHEGHGPASVGEPVRRILLRATGRLHDAVHRDLGNGDDLSHCLSPASSLRIPEDEHLTVPISACRFLCLP